MARACLRLPDSKTGSKVIPLGAPAVELLASLPRLEGNPYVLPGNKTGGHFVGLPKVWRRVRARARLPGVRLHDLRHSFASSAVGLGESHAVIGKLLGHTQVQTTARYAHLADNPVQASAERVSSEIARLMNGKVKAKISASG